MALISGFFHHRPFMSATGPLKKSIETQDPRIFRFTSSSGPVLRHSCASSRDHETPTAVSTFDYQAEAQQGVEQRDSQDAPARQRPAHSGTGNARATWRCVHEAKQEQERSIPTTFVQRRSIRGEFTEERFPAHRKRFSLCLGGRPGRVAHMAAEMMDEIAPPQKASLRASPDLRRL